MTKKAKTFGGVTYKTIMSLPPEAIVRFWEWLVQEGARRETDYWERRGREMIEQSSIKTSRKLLWEIVKDAADGGLERLGGAYVENWFSLPSPERHSYVVPVAR